MSNKPLKPKSWLKWAIIFLGWTGFAIFFTTQSYIVQARYTGKINWNGTLVDWLLGSYTWFILTPLILRMSNRFPLQRGKLLRSVVAHIAAAPVFNIINIAIYVVAQELSRGAFPGARAFFESLRSLIVIEFHGGMLVYLAIIGISQAIDYYRKYRERELQTSNLETRLAEAQLDALRMQLHPHFLFNTLNSVSVLMRRDVDAADRMLIQLSNLLRGALAGNSAHEIKLEQELEILERYLEIEQIRFKDRLTVRMRIDPSALDALVPQLFFQPLVENAIRHGIAELETGGVIEILAERRNGMMLLEVRDNGPGLSGSRENLIEGVGLSNTRSRLGFLYGSEGRFDVSDAEGGGMVVAAAFPFRT